MSSSVLEIGARVRIIGSPEFTGTVVRYYQPVGWNVNVLVKWDRHGDNGIPTAILESQLEQIPA